jgi:hypothetical protein
LFCDELPFTGINEYARDAVGFVSSLIKEWGIEAVAEEPNVAIVGDTLHHTA